jgi:YidC/Oxa1 family membrane protein insertase
MDRKVLFQAILWSVAAYMLFLLIVGRLWPPPPLPPPGTVTTQSAPPTSGPTPLPAEAEASPQPSPSTAAAARATTGAAVLQIRGAEEEAAFVLGSTVGGEESPYRAEIHTTARGAAVDTVFLSDYKVAVDAERAYRLAGPLTEGDDTLRSLALETAVVDGTEVRLDQALWRGRQEEGSSGTAVVYTCDLVREGRAILRLERCYRLTPTPAKAQRFDFRSELTVQNLSGEAHALRLTERGPVGLAREEARADDRCVNVGIFQEGVVQHRAATPFADVSKNTQALKLFTEQDKGRLWWVAVENKYFAFISTPVRANGSEDPGYVYEVSAADHDGKAQTPNDVMPRLVLGPFDLPAGEALTLGMEHYVGPKDKRVFLSEHNADYARRNYHLLNQDRPSSCTFGWLTELMVSLLNWFYAVVHNYGVAIFLLVLLVRVLLHPITKKTQVNMVKMQQSMSKLQPKLEEVKKRCANDRPRLQQETMRVYKEAGVNPAGQMLSCLPMMLQMPIWVALYSSLNNNIAMRHEGFIWWIKDLTAPDHLYKLSQGFNFPLVGEVTAFNLLPFLVGATMYLQQKFTPKAAPPKADASDQAAQMQQQMQTMMPIMSIFMIVIFYNMPSGLNLYIMTSSLLGSLEQWRIRKHVEATKSHGPSEPPPPPAPAPKSDAAHPRSPGFVERLMKKADEAQKLRRSRK